MIPVWRSLLQEEALSAALADAYGWRDVRCELWKVSMRDVYRVEADGERFMLFIYRHVVRTAEMITEEWAFVDFLAGKGVSVTPAVRRKSGELLMRFDAPEGERFGVVSVFAEGKTLREAYDAGAVYRYGAAVAAIHLGGADFGEGNRPVNIAPAILTLYGDAAIEALRERLPDTAQELTEAQSFLQEKWPEVVETKLGFGMIHGDVIRANALVAAQGVTVIDFDLCGYGAFAYDVASYLQTVRGLPEEAEATQAFLSGYNSVRPLTDAEVKSLPLYLAVRCFFDLGIPALNRREWGAASLSDSPLRSTITLLRESIAAI